jgi:hypothetical protein
MSRSVGLDFAAISSFGFTIHFSPMAIVEVRYDRLPVTAFSPAADTPPRFAKGPPSTWCSDNRSGAKPDGITFAF